MIKHSLINFLLLLGGLCFSTSTYAANMSITESVNGRYILIEGNIEKGDYEKFIEAVLNAGSSARHVFIASKGGVAVEAIKIGKLIRSLHYSTEVPYYYTSEGEGAYCKSEFPIPKSNCLCLSSCVLIYLAGIERNGDYLGIHRTFVNHKQLKNLSLQEAKKYSIQISRTIDSYVTSMGAPKSLLEKIESISSEDVELLSYEFINKYLRGYSLKYQEWILAKCGSTTELLEEQRRTKGDKNKFLEITKKIEEIVKCEDDLIQQETEKSFYPTIKVAFSSLDEEYIPRRSLIDSIKDNIPFNMSELIGKTNLEAMDLLSLIGIPNKYSNSEMKKFNNASFRIDNSMIIGFDTDGTVYSINIPFHSLNDNKVFNRHFLEDLNAASEPDDFVKQYGKPSRQGCSSLSDVCFLIFTTPNADLKVSFNEDRSLLMIKFSEAGYWDRLYREKASLKAVD